jgi:3-hydroxyisobutyrate dehydrogenase-like beta-hydroxyacid dehydrogenase
MSRKARKNVGVIGLGIIGSRVAAGLRAAGYQVYIWNRSAKPAPNFLGSPAEVAESAEIIQIFVADAAALFDVVEAMADTLTAKHVIVCNATVGPEAVLEAAKTVEARGAQFLDAPFTGSKVAAEKRQLVYYVGGAEVAYLRVKPVLEATSKAIVRMGEIGHASTVKVVTNMISAVTIQALAEALSIVTKAGLEPELLASAIEQNACRSGVIDLKLPKMMAGDYEPHFSLKHMFKDVQLGIHMANALDIEIPTTTVTAGVMYGALNAGWGDLDFSSLFKNYAASEATAELPALPQTADRALFGEPAAAIDLSLEGAAKKESEPPAAEHTEAVAAGVAEIASLASLLASVPHPPTLVPPVVEADADRTEDKESSPTLEAPRILEPLLVPAGGDGPNLESASEPARVDAFTSSADAAENRAQSDTKSVDSGGGLEPEPEQSEVGVPAGDEAEPTVRPNNFVRRWFVARS